MVAGERQIIRDVARLHKSGPLVTSEGSLDEDVIILHVSVNTLPFVLRVMSSSVEQPIMCISVYSGTCLIAGLLPLIIILMTALLFSMTYSSALWRN